MSIRSRRKSATALSRRRFVAAGACLALATGLKPARALNGPVIKFGLTPVFLNNDLQLLNALKAYLGKATGFGIELITRRTYQEVTSLLVSGQLDAAWICGYPFIQFRDSLELVAIPEWNSKPLYQSYLIVASGREAQTIADLRGDIHAFSDPNSNSGFLVTRTLMFEQGFKPESFFRKTLFTYGHRNVIRAVASNLAQSGSVDGYVWEVMRELEPELVSRTRVMHRSQWLGFPPIATSRKSADTGKTHALQAALIGMANDPQGRRVLDMLKLTGFAMPKERVYDGIVRMVDELRGVL